MTLRARAKRWGACVAVLQLTMVHTALRAQTPAVTGCYHESRPLGAIGMREPDARDSLFRSVMLREGGRVLLPELPENERSGWERRSEWQLRGDTLILTVFSGLQGWRARLRPSAAADGWSGSAGYLSDAVGPRGFQTTIVPVTLSRLACPAAWRSLAPAAMRLSPSLSIYYADQVDKEAAIDARSPLPKGAQLNVRSGVPARSVLVQLVVDSLGRALPDRVKILKTDSDSLSSRVFAAVPLMRFTPAIVQRRPVAQLVQWQFVFPSR